MAGAEGGPSRCAGTRAGRLCWPGGEQGAGGTLPTPPLSLPRARYTPITHSTAFTAPPARSPPRHQAWDNTPGPKQPLPSSGAMRPGLGSWGGWPGPEGTHLGVQGAAGEGSCAHSPSFAAREGTGGVGTPWGPDTTLCHPLGVSCPGSPPRASPKEIVAGAGGARPGGGLRGAAGSLRAVQVASVGSKRECQSG